MTQLGQINKSSNDTIRSDNNLLITQLGQIIIYYNYYNLLEPEEWGLLSLGQAETFNWVESIIPILKDKATSPRGEFAGDYFAYMGGLVSPFKELSRKERNCDQLN